MARYKIPYTSLNDSLKHLRIQIIDSLPYTVRNLPRFDSPEKVFNYCKENFVYKNDPAGIELFQSVPTLLANGGAGDCDCATIFVIAMLLNSGFTNCGIVLTGRTKLNASHIYAYNIDDKDEKQFLDLTNKNFNQIRFYPFTQCIPFKISKNQLNMFLQLADSSAKRRLKVNFRKAKPNESIFLPSKNTYIPFEKMDKLPIKKVKQTLLSEGYAVEQLGEYLSGRAERKQRKANKQVKFETKQAKKSAKTDVIKAKAEKKSATAQKRISKGKASETKAEAKRLKQERKGEEDESAGMKIFNKAGEFVTTVMTNKQGGEEQESEEQEPEATEGEEQEQEPQEQETELEEGSILNKTDWLSLVVFGAGIFLEKTKRV